MDAQLEPGSVVAARYRLERVLGEGGMGVVWAATHEITKKRFALKLVKRAESASPRARLLREARASCAVRHPHVREVYDILESEDGAPVMVMEYLAGASLAARLAREGKLALAEAAAVVLPVVSAVGAAHALGIVHRDLKPENIFLAEGPPAIVKVLDFGIAKLTAIEGAAAASTALTASGALLGTPHYMSPEQVFGEKDLDHRTDIWALGLMLYRCLSGTLPTQADNIGQVFKNIVARPIRPLEEVAPGLPPEVTALVGRMLSRARDGRPADLREVAEVLARHTSVRVPGFDAPSLHLEPTAPSGAPEAGEATSEEPTTEPGPLSRSAGVDAPGLGRTPGSASRGAVVVGLAVLAAGGGLMAWRGRGAEHPAAVVAASAQPALEEKESAADAGNDADAAASDGGTSARLSEEPARSATGRPRSARGRTAVSVATATAGSAAPTAVPVQKDW